MASAAIAIALTRHIVSAVMIVSAQRASFEDEQRTERDGIVPPRGGRLRRVQRRDLLRVLEVPRVQRLRLLHRRPRIDRTRHVRGELARVLARITTVRNDRGLGRRAKRRRRVKGQRSGRDLGDETAQLFGDGHEHALAERGLAARLPLALRQRMSR